VGTFARLVASSVTGLLNDLGGYRLAFFLALGVSILAILIVFSAQEAQLQPQKPSFKNISRVVIRQDVLLPSTLGTLALHAEWAVTFGFLPILAKQIGVSDVGQSVLLSTYLIAYMLGNFVAISLSSPLKDRLLYICFAVISIGMVSVMIAQSMPMFLTVQALIGIAQGVCYPTLMGLSITNVASADRSTAMGIYQTLYAVGMFTGPWLSGLLAAAIGIRPMFGVTACALISLSLILIHRLLSLKSDMQNELVELNY
jgi:MFS family permease